MCGKRGPIPAGEHATTAWLIGEPHLDELLADPVVFTLMRSDRIDPARFRVFLDAQRRRARARTLRARDDGRDGDASPAADDGADDTPAANWRVTLSD